MNIPTKSAELACRGPRMNFTQCQPSIRAFINDLTVTTGSVPGCQWILQVSENLLDWTIMHFKPARSRSMVLRKGKAEDKFWFSIAGTATPTIFEKPVKSLGKDFDSSPTTSIQATCTKVDGWLKFMEIWPT